MEIVFFDFDGTITTKDTFIDFIQYTVGKPAYYFGLLQLSPIITAYKLRLIPNYVAKEKVFGFFFRDWEVDYFLKFANSYSKEEINNIVRPKAIERIKWHQNQCHTVVIVSASIECWLQKWCENYNIELISTRIEFVDGKITGKFATKNCFGIEKVNRIKERFNLSDYSYIYTYGDSAGDKEMLSISNASYYKYFR